MRRLTAEREQRGWSKAKLAREADLNVTTVGLIEAGRLIPYRSQLEKLARALGIPATEAGALIEEAGRELVTA